MYKNSFAYENSLSISQYVHNKIWCKRRVGKHYIENFRSWKIFMWSQNLQSDTGGFQNLIFCVLFHLGVLNFDQTRTLTSQWITNFTTFCHSWKSHSQEKLPTCVIWPVVTAFSCMFRRSTFVAVTNTHLCVLSQRTLGNQMPSLPAMKTCLWGGKQFCTWVRKLHHPFH